MDMLIRLLVSLVMLLGMAAGLGFAQPQCLADLGLDFWKLTEYNQWLATATTTNDKLQDQFHHLKSWGGVKDQLVKDLIHQKKTLAETIALLEEGDHQGHLDVALEVLGIESGSRQEKLGKLVLYWVENGSPQPGQTSEALSRLDKELNLLKAGPGSATPATVK